MGVFLWLPPVLHDPAAAVKSAGRSHLTGKGAQHEVLAHYPLVCTPPT
jgi:hypothetical protein